jgi:hypothetical protein
MVSDVYFPRINGVSTSIETFRAALGEHGIEVGLVAPRYGDEIDSAGIVRIPGRRLPRDPEDRLMHYGRLRDPGLRALLSTQAREYAREWSDHALAQRMARLYQGLAATR